MAMTNISLSIFWLSILTAACCSGGVRRFTYVYEATTSAPGGFDLETWITWRTHTRNDPNLDQIDFRHELEVGITQSLQVSVYLADWNYQDGVGSDGYLSVFGLRIGPLLHAAGRYFGDGAQPARS